MERRGEEGKERRGEEGQERRGEWGLAAGGVHTGRSACSSRAEFFCGRRGGDQCGAGRGELRDRD